MKKGQIALIVGAVLITLLVAFGFAFVVRATDIVFLNDITVATEEQLLRTIDIGDEINILSLDEKKIKKTVEKNFAENEIEVVDIVRHFPNRVVVKVRERKRIYKIATESGGYVAPDRDFLRNRIYTEEELPERLITVTGYAVGTTFDTEECYLLKNVALYFEERGFTDTSLTYLIREIDLQADSFSVTLFDGTVFVADKRTWREDLQRGYESFLQTGENREENEEK